MLDEGDSAGVPQDSFENHFRDMFLNMSIYNILHAHSFKAALIAFLAVAEPGCFHRGGQGGASNQSGVAQKY